MKEFKFPFQEALSAISRLARVLATPHNIGHVCLLTEGNPGTAYLLARLAAHLNGFNVRMVTPHSAELTGAEKLRLFKQDLINAYTQAGVKVSGFFCAILILEIDVFFVL